MEYIILLLIIIAVILFFVIKSKGGPAGKVSTLRNRCKSLLNLPPDEADQVIDRLIERQKEKNPGKTEEWYLDKILYDLEKDKN